MGVVENSYKLEICLARLGEDYQSVFSTTFLALNNSEALETLTRQDMSSFIKGVVVGATKNHLREFKQKVLLKIYLEKTISNSKPHLVYEVEDSQILKELRNAN